MYAMLWPAIVEVADAHGYAVALHGSLDRDMDVLAAPWTEDAADVDTLVEAIAARLGLFGVGHKGNRELRPHGRLGWSLTMTGGAYIDLSVMPRRP